MDRRTWRATVHGLRHNWAGVHTRVASGPFNQLFRDATSEFLSYSDWLITSGVIVELQEDTNIQNRSSVPTHQAGWCLKHYQSDFHPFVLRSLLLVNCRSPWYRHLGECDAVNRWAELSNGEGAAQHHFSRNLKLTVHGGEHGGKERSSEVIAPTSQCSLRHESCQREVHLKVPNTVEAAVKKAEPTFRIIVAAWEMRHHPQSLGWWYIRLRQDPVSAFLDVKNPDFKHSNWSVDQLIQSKIFKPFSVQAGTIFRAHLLKVYECAQSHLTLLPMDCIPPGSSVRGIIQSKILEWVAISYSKKYKKTSRENCL